MTQLSNFDLMFGILALTANQMMSPSPKNHFEQL
jgi:hypothetical protein